MHVESSERTRASIAQVKLRVGARGLNEVCVWFCMREVTPGAYPGHPLGRGFFRKGFALNVGVGCARATLSAYPPYQV